GRDFSSPVVVEGDPLVPLASDDRGKRRLIITSLLRLQAQADPAAVRAESTSDQLEALTRSLSNAANTPAAIRSAVTSAAKQADGLKTELARINRSISQLYGQVNGSPFLPTETERDELEDLQKEYSDRSAALDTLLRTTIPSLEKQLNEAGIPRISVK